MTVLYPEATPVLGNTKVLVTPSVATKTAPDLSAEIGHASALDISMFIRNWNPDIQTNTGTAPTRLGTTLQLPLEGQTQLSGILISYVYDPQAATSTDDNKARLLLTQGSEHAAVVRKGLPFTTAFDVGQYTETLTFRCGRQNYVQSGDDEFSEYEIQQYLFPLIEPVHGQIVA